MQLAEGENSPAVVEKETVPVGDDPVTVAVHFVDIPSATTEGEHKTAVTATGGTLATASIEGARATGANSTIASATFRDGARWVIPNTASKNEIIPSSIGEMLVLTASVTPLRPWLRVAVSDEERDCVTPESPSPTLGARLKEAETIARKLAAPARAGLSAMERESGRLARPSFTKGATARDAESVSRKAAAPAIVGVSAVEAWAVTPAMSCPMEVESTCETAFPIPASDCPTAGESEIDAETKLTKAAMAPRAGVTATATEFATPAMS